MLLASIASVMIFIELSFLLRRGFHLVLRLPLDVRHAVNDFASLFKFKLNSFILGPRTIPLTLAVTTKASEIHQIDVLHICPFTKVLN